jgi:plastocyanin
MRIAAYWVLSLAVSLVGCKSKQMADEAPPSLQHTEQVDQASSATISGVVKFQGTAPKLQNIDMSQDPACGSKPAFDESVAVSNGDLANVFVYVKDGFHNGAFGRGGPAVVVEQRGCRYHPHVLGVVVGDLVKIVNADDTTHNIHPMPAANKQWNESQLPKAEPIVKTFSHPEIMIPIKCNQHPWMKMYLNVVSNPFFAVTDENGKFEIKGLPPGEYTLAAVHEKLGEQTMKISVGPKDSKTTDFTFKAQ